MQSFVNRSGQIVPDTYIDAFGYLRDLEKEASASTVIQLDMNGNVLMTDDNATFATTKESAKEILGSAEKIGDNEILIGDSVNKRAIIVNTDTGKIEWEYNSGKYIVDARIVSSDGATIAVRDDGINEPNIDMRQGLTVTWVNSTNHPISIYSGKTSYDDFQLDKDLTLYGTEFKSPVLQPGERWGFKFLSVEEQDWFTYPDILTGKISITKNRISTRDEFWVLESDNLESPFSSRLLKVDSFGNVIFDFGSGYLVKPRDVRSQIDGSIVIST
jgi:hypothetical protein